MERAGSSGTCPPVELVAGGDQEVLNANYATEQLPIREGLVERTEQRDARLTLLQAQRRSRSLSLLPARRAYSGRCDLRGGGEFPPLQQRGSIRARQW